MTKIYIWYRNLAKSTELYPDIVELRAVHLDQLCWRVWTYNCLTVCTFPPFGPLLYKLVWIFPLFPHLVDIGDILACPCLPTFTLCFINALCEWALMTCNDLEAVITSAHKIKLYRTLAEAIQEGSLDLPRSLGSLLNREVIGYTKCGSSVISQFFDDSVMI